MGNGSYLTERKYRKSNNQNLNPAFVKHWKKLLGEEVYDMLLAEIPEFKCYLGEEPFVEGSGNGLRIEELDRPDENRMTESDVFFAEFYHPFLQSSRKRLEERVRLLKEYFSQHIFYDFEIHLVKNLEKICLRTLIAELHLFKDNGLLQGSDSRKEYEYFCREIVGTAEFMERLQEGYPVLLRCISEKTEQLIDYYEEIITAFAKDRKEIEKEIFNGKAIGRITGIQGDFSDVHNNGKQVLRIQIDKSKYILYKPHSMENERVYQELLEWLEAKTYIRQYRYAFLSRENYSWCSIVEYHSCETEQQLGWYYQRLGVQLFLAYILGTKDLHCENLIACGEYPVFIDLETLVQVQGHMERRTAAEEICYQLSESVLYTGMLPLYHWNQEGTGVNSSAVSGAEGQNYPFKVPTVINAGTSEMRIGYHTPVSRSSKNLATVKGVFQSPAGYKKEMLEGFQKAYQCVMRNQEEFRVVLRRLKNTRSRFLVADTQRYSMMLSSSYHPSLLMDGADREIFLYSMWKGRKSEDKEVVIHEVKDLLRGDIPYFSYHVNQTGLYSSNGSVINDYFMEPAVKVVNQKIDVLSNQDMMQQCEYICLSIELMPQEKESFANRVYHADKNASDEQAGSKDETKKRVIEELKNRLLRHAVWNRDETEVSWFCTQMYQYHNSTWKIMPMNYYLYGGLAGMLLLTYESGEERLYRTLRDMLFQYTDKSMHSSEELISRRTGIYEGESSIIFTYLLMYNKSGKEEYLKYAKKHAQTVNQLLAEDQLYDLISGNAGAAWAMLYLYRITKDREYLKAAEEAVEHILIHAEIQQIGIGWSVEKDCPPLAGMAHGNSGILMVLLALWVQTGREKYELAAEQVWRYENTLYDESVNNWKDLRYEGRGVPDGDSVAWCHGAAGILLSRIECCRIAENPEWRKRLREDCIRAYNKLEQYWKRDSWCLCHGILGNIWILKYGAEFLGKELNINVDYDIKLLPQESLNPGILNGYGGMLYYLLREGKGKLPDILGIFE